jgi:hypothetical protein
VSSNPGTHLTCRSRIALRAPFLRDPLLRHSSLSICARAALSIIHFHRHVVSAALLNLPWMQIRRVAISTYIIFIAFWRGEITKVECEQAVNSSLEVLCVLSTRWRSAAQVAHIVTQLADKSGRFIFPLYRELRETVSHLRSRLTSRPYLQNSDSRGACNAR